MNNKLQKEKLNILITYLNKKYETKFPIIYVEKKDDRHNCFSIQDRKIILNLTQGNSLTDMCWILAHEFAHGLQFTTPSHPLYEKNQVELKKFKVYEKNFFILFTVFIVSVVPIKFLLSIGLYFTIYSFGILGLFVSYLGYKSLRQMNKYCHIRIDLEEDADKFANELIGGSEKRFSLLLSEERLDLENEQYFRMHPYTSDRMRESGNYPLREEFLKKLGILDDEEIKP
jgi:hypothetical protein